MILILGGTTEGRSSVTMLEEAGSPFFYSTKGGEQQVPLHHGMALSGAMTSEQMQAFCREHDIRLLIDAAHPYAARLHTTVAKTAQALDLPVIRYERQYPDHYDERIVWFDAYDELVAHLLQEEGGGLILATTGVQSIARLQPLESKYTLRYRILRRESSIQLALRQGATSDQLCYYGEQEEEAFLQVLKPTAILVKDSGLSGGFEQKVQAALSLGIRVLALRRPPLPASFIRVDGPYGLRRQVEALLPAFFPLHSGLTTGTYATAAALAQATRLLRGDTPSQVVVTLPNGEHISVPVSYGDDYAACIKVSGDDPDVTNGVEIRARVHPLHALPEEISRKAQSNEFHCLRKKISLRNVFEPADGSSSERIQITGGQGIGRFTLPGLDYPPGEAAINRVPREMIRQNITERLHPQEPLEVEISVPEGAELARRTFNPRIGIVGGISIVGSSGIIMPFSNESFITSIRRCMEVAQASGTDRIVINSGAKSAQFVRTLYPDLPSQAFVEYGNFIGEALKMAEELGVKQLSLCIMIGKAVKLAGGYLDTHSRQSVLDPQLIADLGRRAGLDEELVAKMGEVKIARELWTLIPAAQMPAFAKELLYLCRQVCAPLLPHGALTIHLIHPPIGAVYTNNPS